MTSVATAISTLLQKSPEAKETKQYEHGCQCLSSISDAGPLVSVTDTDGGTVPLISKDGLTISEIKKQYKDAQDPGQALVKLLDAYTSLYKTRLSLIPTLETDESARKLVIIDTFKSIEEAQTHLGPTRSHKVRSLIRKVVGI
jgi:hypothetical protein